MNMEVHSIPFYNHNYIQSNFYMYVENEIRTMWTLIITGWLQQAVGTDSKQN